MRICFCIFFFITYCTLKAFTQTNVSGNVFGTWAKANSPYVMTGDVTVQSGRTLTIEPGVEIRCSNYSYDISVSGTLIAKGTAADSIKFKGFPNPTVSSQSTHAGSIKFEQNSINSQLEYVNVDRWGDVNAASSYGAVHLNSSGVTISKSTISNSEEYSIRVEYYALTPTISNNTFINNPYGIRIYNRAGITPNIRNNNFSNTPIAITAYIHTCKNTLANTNAAIHLLGEISSEKGGILQKQGTNSFFKLENTNISIRQGDTLEIKPGVEIRSYRYDDYISVSGTLIAKGTPADSIRFRGFANPTVSALSTHGGSLRLVGNSQLEYVSIDRWGDANYGFSSAIFIASSNVIITNSTIRNSEKYAIESYYLSTSTISNNSFINNPYGIKLSSGASSPTITNNNFVNTPIGITGYIHVCSNISSNTNAVIQLLGERTNQDGVLQKQGANSYYRLENSGITIRQGDTIVIKPGVEIRSYNYSDNIRVEGTLIAKGMATDSIKFRGFANPMVSNLSTHGGYLSFESSSTNSQLEYVDIDRWGDATSARYSSTVYINTPEIVISKSTIRNSETNCIYIDSGSPTISNNSFINNISGIKISSTAGSGGSSTVSPTVSNNEFINTPTGITTPIHTCSNIFSNVNAVIQLLGGSTYHNGVLQKQGVNSFFKLSGFTTEIRQGNTIEIKPGVEIRSYHYNDVISVYGTLIAKGTASDSIRFKGFANPTVSIQSTHGGSLEFQSGSINSQLEYVNIDRWGDINSTSYYGAIYISSSSLTISKCTIRNSEEYGIRMSSNAHSNITNPTIISNHFSNNPLGDITTYPNSLGNVFNNTNAKIIINPGNFLANMSWPYPGAGSYYILTNRTTIPAAYTLTIEAGSLIDFGQNAELYVEGTLKAIGTELTPIQFVRLQDPTSNIYGGRVYLRPASTNSVINYVFFDKLGSTNSSDPVLDVATSNFSISNITISNSPVVGLRYTATGKPTISSSNFINNKTGISVSSGSPTFNNCNIYGNTEFGISNTSSSVADTVDARNCYWGHNSGPLHATLNPGGLGNKVSNKVKFNPWRNQPQNGQIIDLGISALLTPVSDCNLTNSQSITVRIRNYGNVSPGNFQVSYRINTGAVITETVSSGSLLPGKSLDYTFVTKASVSATGTYAFMAYSSIPQDALYTNDTLKTQIQHYLNVASPVNLIPANNSSNLDIPVTLSWSAVPNATGYDVFVWKSTDPIPTQPIASNLNQISYVLPSATLSYGTDYKWKIAARRVSCRTESIIQNFTTRQLPDLIVESVTGPANATSETNITFYWKIKNQGPGSTGSSGWQDVAYLCDQPTLSASTEKFYIGSVPNFSALAAGQLYQSANFTYRLPQGIQGVYYLIVQCNPSQSSKETSTANNQKSSTAITISLSPPPDLQVTSVIVSLQNVFSEDSLRVTYKVKNAGTGPTTQSNWSDYIYLSQNQILNTNSAILLNSYQRNQTLTVGSEYTIIAKTKLPARINGTYYVHVYTDRFNSVFEYNKENNNITNSLPLSVVQRPTPDLKISSLTIGVDSISNDQPLTVQWTTTNDGAIAAKPNWQEYIYLSTDAVFNENTDRYAGSMTRTAALNSLSSSSAQQSITIPSTLAEGNYYFFIKADASNSIYESPDETNNISPASSLIRIVNADLKPILFSSPGSAFSEQEITVQWTIKNDSRAIIQNRNWTDKLYLSSNSTFESSSDLLLATVNNSQLLSKEGQYTKQISVKLPVGIAGNYFLLLVSDVNNNVFERLENNNTLSHSITLSLAPWPDILGNSISIPASDTIGTSIRIQYSAKNNGAGTILNGNWTDNIYLSKTNNPNETNLVLLGSILQKRSLTSNETYSPITTFSLPSTLTAGQYYVFVKTDFTNLIFENTGETNNTYISNITVNLVVNAALSPTIDLSVIAGQLQTASVTAGQSVTIQWQVKNNSFVSTVSSSWRDAVYLSSNPTLDVSDVLLSMVTITSPLAAGATYTQNYTVTIPQDASGTMYLLVNTDKDNQNNDDNRGNNTIALTAPDGGQSIAISIPPPADLVPVSFTAPTEGVAAQPVSISFTIKNQGAGPTPTSNWIDHIYLSTDFQLSNNDILIGSLPHTGSLASGSQYTASGQFFIPNSASGNYVLLLKADANDMAFERNNEGNNLAFSNILINPQQPSDLIISEVTVPTGEQYAGSKVTINWKLKNVGVNIANGIKRDAVYFSKDSILDATDILFGVADKNIYLPSQSTDNNSLTGVLANVSVGSYYVILKTDILNNITEIDNDNNQAVSVGKIIINIKNLPIGVEKRDTITKSEPLYYRIEIPQNLANETLKVNLLGENNAVNRLYISYNQTPTSNTFDFESTIPFKPNQSTVITQLKPGTYYLLALGEDPVKTKQPITLLATIIPFAITDITAKEGGNTGLITVKINGAKFDSKTTFRLRKSPAETILPNKVYIIDQTASYVTFNLSGKLVGNYDVLAVKENGETATLSNSFAVVQGPAGSFDGNTSGFVCNISNIGFEEGLETALVAPAFARRGQIVSFTVSYKNTGTVDVPVQTRFLISLNENIPVGFSLAELSEKKQDLILVCEEKGGPPGILRPGASGFFKIYAVSNRSNIDVTITE